MEACQSRRDLPAAGFSKQGEEGGCVSPAEGVGPLPRRLSTRSQKAQRSMCHQRIVVNKVDLLFQPCHHSCVVFDARPAGGEKSLIRTLKGRRRPQKAAPLAAGTNSQGREVGGLCQEAVPWMSGNETAAGPRLQITCVKPWRSAHCLFQPPRVRPLLGPQMQVSLGHWAGREHWAGGFSSAVYL